MKTNQQVFDAFMNGESSGSANNLKISGDLLINYSTTIAQRLPDKKYILNTVRYSVSTTRIQLNLKKLLPEDSFSEVNNVPQGYRGPLNEEIIIE